MSKFFDDIDEEKKEIKKKIHTETAPKNTQKLSKKEKLFLELQTRVFDLEDDDSKKSEKNIKKFLSDLKKYENSYDELPNFLKEFLTSEKVYVKGNVKIVDAFLSKYEKNEEEEVLGKLDEIKVEETNEKDSRKEFNSIKDISDPIKRKDQLIEFSKRIQNEELKVEALVILLSICARLNDPNDLYNILQGLTEYLNNEKVKLILKNNLDSYLEIINTIDLNLYQEILVKMKAIDPVVCERRILEIEFFINKITVESNYVDFKLLTAIFENDLDKSTKFFKSIMPQILRGLTGDIKKLIEPVQENETVYEDKVFYRIVKEYAHFSFTNQMYEESLICFLYISQTGEKSIFLDLLCVILNKKIGDTDLFKDFLVRFREFSNNPLVLPSHDSTSEIFRAFFYLHNFDVDSCFNIITSFDNSWNDKNTLIDSARSILYK